MCDRSVLSGSPCCSGPGPGSEQPTCPYCAGCMNRLRVVETGRWYYQCGDCGASTHPVGRAVDAIAAANRRAAVLTAEEFAALDVLIEEEQLNHKPNDPVLPAWAALRAKMKALAGEAK